MDLLKEVFEFLSGFEWKKLPWEQFHRKYRNPKRTLEKIVRSKFFLGCYEPAIILYERVRENNIQARFMEMIDVRFGEDNIYSHCFIELKLNGKWIIVDPTQRVVIEDYPEWYVVFSKGIHKWNSFDEFHQAQKKFVRNRG